MPIGISIIYGTARGDYPLIDMPNVHQFKPFLDSLVGQSFKEFEVIIADANYNGRSKEVLGDIDSYRKYFPIKHLSVDEFSWARKKKLWALQDGFNYGIVWADGQLLLWMGDCCELVGKDTLLLFWDWYLHGYFASALAVYYKGNLPFYVSDAVRMNYYSGCGAIQELIRGGFLKDVVRDSRWKYVEDEDECKKSRGINCAGGNGIYYCPGSMFYGYASSSLESMLRINGYDSNFDGEKSLGDVEAGMRLEKLGYKFVLDKRLWLIERAHLPIDPGVLMPIKSFRSNYSLMLLNQKKDRTIGNNYKLTADELEWIIKHGESWSVPRPIAGSIEWELLMGWYNNPPIYDLAGLRNERLKGKI